MFIIIVTSTVVIPIADMSKKGRGEFMRKWILGLITVVGATSAFAQANTSQYHLMDLNFGAPVVSGDPTAADTKVGSIVYDLSTHSFRGLFDNGAWASISSGATAASPTIQKFLSGSGTYTTPGGVLYIRVRMIGGGGGGAGSGSTQTVGSAGGSSTFGTSLLIAGGGAGGNGYSPGVNSTAAINSPAVGSAFPGTAGSGGASQGTIAAALPGGNGGSSFFGGGAASPFDSAGSNALANSGSGGSGGSSRSNTGSTAGAGGTAGAYVDALISNPASSYSYTVGTGGTGGSAGTIGYAGGNGGSGYIEVTEFYQ